jgi:hypothetical protein
MNLLIIDNRVEHLNQIIRSLNWDTKYVILNYQTDTFETLQNKIIALNIRQIKNVALVSHGYHLPVYKMMENSPKLSVTSISPDSLNEWSIIVNFIKWLNIRFLIENFDFLACSLLKTFFWKNIIKHLEQQTGVNIRASSDDTGSLKMGANWNLSRNSMNVNIRDLYFNESVEQSDILLFLNPFEINLITSLYVPGDVVTWGNTGQGGDTSGVSTTLVGAINVASTNTAFAALLPNGTVTAWGDTDAGGDPTLCGEFTDPSNYTNVGGVVNIFSNTRAFAVLFGNNTAESWGDLSAGGNADQVLLQDIQYIFSRVS